MHNMKKMIISIIIFLLTMQSLYAGADNIPTLTLESAITYAKAHSIELSQIRRVQELNGEKLDQVIIDGNYKSYQKQYLENQYTEKEEVILEKVIAYEVSKLFDEIILNEAKLKDLENSLKMDKTSLEFSYIKLNRGLISQDAIDKSILAFETTQNSKRQLESTINAQYTTLCEMTGKTYMKFILEKESLIYEPFEISENIEGVLVSKVEQNLSVWKALEAAKLESTIDYDALSQAGSTYLAYLQLQENTVKAQETGEAVKEQFETTLRNKYTELIQLQDKYKLLEKELVLLEKQLKTKRKQYESGYISKIAYENLKLSYEQARTGLLESIIKQEYSKQAIENPYLL